MCYELSHQKRGATLSVPILGVISPLFAYSCNSYGTMSGLLSFEYLSHGTNLTIFYVIVCGDLISYTCIISDIVLDHDKKVRVTGIGARKYIQRYNFR